MLFQYSLFESFFFSEFRNRIRENSWNLLSQNIVFLFLLFSFSFFLDQPDTLLLSAVVRAFSLPFPYSLACFLFLFSHFFLVFFLLVESLILVLIDLGVLKTSFTPFTLQFTSFTGFCFPLIPSLSFSPSLSLSLSRNKTNNHQEAANQYLDNLLNSPVHCKVFVF